jgi:hypothetical protein
MLIWSIMHQEFNTKLLAFGEHHNTELSKLGKTETGYQIFQNGIQFERLSEISSQCGKSKWIDLCS